MAALLPDTQSDTIESVFSEKCQRIDMDAYSLYHFDEHTIDGRVYRYRESNDKTLMTVICSMCGQDIILCSVCTKGDLKSRIQEIHDFIRAKEAEQIDPNKGRDPNTIPVFKGFVFDRLY